MVNYPLLNPVQIICGSRTRIVVFFDDDHGGEAVVGRRDANWARGNSAVTDVLLLSAVRVVHIQFKV